MKTEEATYSGIKVSCTEFDAWRGSKLALRVLKVVGPTLAALSSVKSVGDLQSMGSALLPKIAEALTSLDTDEAMNLMGDLLTGTEAWLESGKRVPLIGQIAINQVFSGKLKALFQTVFLAIQTNFADFFDGNVLAEQATELSAQ